MFALHALFFEPGPLLIVRLAFAAVLIVLAFIDLDHRILPNRITLPAWLWALRSSAVPAAGLASSLIGVAVGGGVLWAIGELYFRLRGIEGMGMGDVKMLAMVGAVPRLEGGDRDARARVVRRRARRRRRCCGYSANAMKYALPFGTFLSAGALVASLVGDRLVAWYLSFYP